MYDYILFFSVINLNANLYIYLMPTKLGKPLKDELIDIIIRNQPPRLETQLPVLSRFWLRKLPKAHLARLAAEHNIY